MTSGQTAKSIRANQRPKSSGFISSLRLMSASDFDIWNLIKRENVCNTYSLTLRYRNNKTMTSRRPKTSTGTVHRRRKGAESISASESDGRVSSQTNFEECGADAENAFKEEYDFDAEEAQEPPLYPHLVHIPGNHSQEVYLKACKEYGVTKSARFYRDLAKESIVVKRQRLGPLGMKACAVALVEAFAIHTIDLTDNGLGPKGAEYLAELLRENIFIKHLTVSDNNLGGEGIDSITRVVTKLDNLVSLNISGNGLGDKEAEKVRPIIEDTHNLKYLNLSHNEFREDGGKILGEALFWNDTIETLDLSWNHIRRKGAVKIAESISKNVGLMSLNLAWNGLHLPGCKALGKTLEKNNSLCELDLSSNRIDRECLDYLLRSLKKNVALKTLRLGENPFLHGDIYPILMFLQQCPTSGLSHIDLKDQLVDQALVEFLEEVATTRKLTMTYGRVRGPEMDIQDEDERALLDEDPLGTLIEFGNIVGVRLMDIFIALDNKGNRSISHAEIMAVLKELHIPLSDRCLELMIKRLDANTQGQLDFREIPDVSDQETQVDNSNRRYTSRAVPSAKDAFSPRAMRVKQKLNSILTKRLSGDTRYRKKIEEMKRRVIHEGGACVIEAAAANVRKMLEESVEAEKVITENVQEEKELDPLASLLAKFGNSL